MYIGVYREQVRWTPHPVIVAIRENKGYIRALLYSYVLYHYYGVGGPPKLQSILLKGVFVAGVIKGVVGLYRRL